MSSLRSIVRRFDMAFILLNGNKFCRINFSIKINRYCTKSSLVRHTLLRFINQGTYISFRTFSRATEFKSSLWTHRGLFKGFLFIVFWKMYFPISIRCFILCDLELLRLLGLHRRNCDCKTTQLCGGNFFSGNQY